MSTNLFSLSSLQCIPSQTHFILVERGVGLIFNILYTNFIIILFSCHCVGQCDTTNPCLLSLGCYMLRQTVGQYNTLAPLLTILFRLIGIYLAMRPSLCRRDSNRLYPISYPHPSLCILNHF